MKIKVVSDLHDNIIQLENSDYDLLFIAGDLGSTVLKEKLYLKSLRKETVCVAGNHLCYGNPLLETMSQVLGIPEYTYKDFLNTSVKNLVKTFKDTNIHYLHNSYFKFQDKVIFGGTMYTDFNLYGKENKEECIKQSQKNIKDFTYVKLKEKRNIRFVTPEDYIRYFKTFKRNLQKCIEETKEDIIVLTHFAPSIQAIDKKYGTDKVNAFFASDLEDFIKENSRIKVWIHGHVHNFCDYNIGQCRVFCNPFGYMGENYDNINDYPDLIINVY